MNLRKGKKALDSSQRLVQLRDREQEEHVVDQPGLARAVGGMAATSGRQVEAGAIVAADVADESVRDRAGHRAALAAGDRIVAVVVPGRIESSPPFEHAEPIG